MSITKWIEIGSTKLGVEGCCTVEDLGPVIGGSSYIGGDRLIPGGTPVAKARQRTVTEVSLRLMVFGDNDFDGVAHGDPYTGVYENIQTLHANVLAIPAGDGTRTATLHWDSQTELTKPCHVLPPMDLVWQGSSFFRGVLRLSFPEGLFDLTP